MLLCLVNFFTSDGILAVVEVNLLAKQAAITLQYFNSARDKFPADLLVTIFAHFPM